MSYEQYVAETTLCSFCSFRTYWSFLLTASDAFGCTPNHLGGEIPFSDTHPRPRGGAAYLYLNQSSSNPE
ncbi:hypothetical protein MY3296_005544 [Beauveria thailandica]